MRKRVISWLLTVVMVVSMLPTSVLADTLAADQEQQTQQEQTAPADTENTVPAGNEETQEQQEPAEEVPVSRSARSGGADSAPTAINDADDFKNMVAGGSYKLTKDIIVTESYASDFSGTFDGNGHTVTLDIAASTANVGLFSKLAGGAVVKNVKVDGTVSGTEGVAGIAAQANGATISGCINCAIISATGRYVGGIVGKLRGGTVENCYNTGAISSSRDRKGVNLGGIAGYIDSNGSVKNCYNSGTTSATADTSNYAAIAGWCDNSTVTNCYYLDTTASAGANGNSQTATSKTAEEMKSPAFAALLGSAFMAKAGDYPALSWETPTAAVHFAIAPANATLEINGGTYTGSTTVALPAADAPYSYTVSCPGYTQQTGSVTVRNKDNPVADPANVTVTLAEDTSAWVNVTFNVTPTGAALTVKQGDTVIKPQSGGSYKLLKGVTYTYTAVSDDEGYEPAAGEVTPTESSTQTVVLKKVQSIAVKNGSTHKTEFEQGDALDTAGLTVTVTYTDNSTKDIIDGFTVTGFNSVNVAENQTLTVHYKGAETTYSVKINEKLFPSKVFNGLEGYATVEYSHTGDKYTAGDGKEFVDDAQEGALRSNSAGMNSTTVTVTVTFLENAPKMLLSFDYKVSSESNYDKLRVAQNGETKLTKSGTVAWTTDNSLTVKGGDIVTLTYSKDSSTASGSDCIWLKNFTVSPLYTLTIAPDQTDATVTLKDKEGKTVSGSNGVYAVKPGEYTYTVTKFGYETATGTIKVETGDVSVPVTLTEAAKYSVTFQITKPEGVTAEPTVTVKSGRDTVYTGNGTNCALPAGDYTYTATLEGCDTLSGSFAVKAAKTIGLEFVKSLTFDDFFAGLDGITAGNGTRYGFEPVRAAGGNYLESKKSYGTTTMKLTAGKPCVVSFQYFSNGYESSYSSSYEFTVKNGSKTLLTAYDESEWKTFSTVLQKGDKLTLSFSGSSYYNVKLKNFTVSPVYTISLNVTGAKDSTVVLQDASGAAITGVDGKYAVPTGMYTYTVSKYGYQTETGRIIVTNKNVDQNVALTALTAYQVKFAADPTDASVTLTHPVGGTIAPETDGGYKLYLGETYAYTVIKADYITVSGSFTAAKNDTIKVTLTYAGAGWDGTTKTKPAQDENGVYQIGTAAELAWFADAVNKGDTTISGKLTANINLNGKAWTAFGKYNYKDEANSGFAGTLDGDRHIVSGLQSTEGLVSCLSSTGTVKNLTVIGTVGGSSHVGGIAATSSGTVENCLFDGTVTTSSGSASAGGIVGRALNGNHIVNCVNTGDIKNTCTSYSSTLSIGGIVGYTHGTVENCYSTGNVSARTDRGTNKGIGGIAGQLSAASAVLRKCYVTGAVTGPEAGISPVVNIVKPGATVENCYYLHAAGTGAATAGTAQKTAEAMRTPEFAADVGMHLDSGNSNGGFPVLPWQGGTPVDNADLKAAAAAVNVLELRGMSAADAAKKAEADRYAEIVLEIYDLNNYNDKVDLCEEYGIEEPSEAVANLHDYFLSALQKHFYKELGLDAENADLLKADATGVYQLRGLTPVSGDPEEEEETAQTYTGFLTLPASVTVPVDEAEKTVAIAWESSNTALVTVKDDGTADITAPASGKATVTLTATLTSGSENKVKTFTLCLWSEAAEQQQTLDDIAAVITARNAAVRPLRGLGLYNDTNDANGKGVEKAFRRLLEEMGYEDVADKAVITYTDGSAKASGFDGAAHEYITANGDVKFFDGAVQLKEAYYAGLEFKVAYGGAEKTITTRAIVGRSFNDVQAQLTEAAKTLTWEMIRGENTNEAETNTTGAWDRHAVVGGITSNLTLPYSISGRYDMQVQWAVVDVAEDSNCLYISSDKDSASGVGNIVRPVRPAEGELPEDAGKETLIARVTYTDFDQYMQEHITGQNGVEVYADVFFDITVAPFDIDATNEMQMALTDKYQSLLVDFVDKTTKPDLSKVDADLQMPRPYLLQQEGIMTDSYNQKVTMVSLTPDVLGFNGYHAMVYRPLPGEEAAEARYVVTITTRGSGQLLARQEFSFTIQPFTQQELDDAAAFMTKALTENAYWDGIKNKNTDKTKVTSDLYPFAEICKNEDGTLKYVRGTVNMTFDGIEADDIPGWLDTEKYRCFRSSRPSVIENELLRVHRPEYNTTVTLDSVLTYTKYAQYWEKFGLNGTEETKERYKDFAQFYKQPVSVELTVTGLTGKADPNENAMITVTVQVDSYNENKHSFTGTNYTFTGKASNDWTAWDAVKACLDNAKYEYTGSGAYLKSITDTKGQTLGEKDDGKSSGWMFGVTPAQGEETLPNTTLDATFIHDGDTVRLFFTNKYIPVDPDEPVDPGTEIPNFDKVYADTKKYIQNNVPAPVVASDCGEWAVLGLARAGVALSDEYIQAYYDKVVAYVQKNMGADGVLVDPESHNPTVTDNERIILALTAIGKDPANVGGKNLLTALQDRNIMQVTNTSNTDINGLVFGLLALNSGNYTQDSYWLVQAILTQQNEDGSWSSSADTKPVVDVDMTAMALQALAPYYNEGGDATVNTAVDKALQWLSAKYKGTGYTSAESCAQVVVALSALQLNANSDSSFVKTVDGAPTSVLGDLLRYYLGKGQGFKHAASGKTADQKATEQALYAMAAYERYCRRTNALYDMTDAVCAHSFGDWQVVSPATCTADGSRQRVCTRCGAVEVQTLPATGHSFSEWAVDKKPTCTETGTEKRTCSVCSKEETRVIAALGHTPGTKVSVDKNDHWNICEVCHQPVNKTEHTYVNGIQCVCGVRKGAEGDADTTIKRVVVSDEITFVLEDNDKLNTPDKVKAELQLQITLKNSKSNKDNTVFMDVSLLVFESNEWRPATKEDLTAGKITVLLPYPEAVAAKYGQYNFTVAHMVAMADCGLDVGTVEFPAVTKTASGLLVTLTGLSPVAISWTESTNHYYYNPTATPDKTDSANTADDSQMVLWLGSAVLAAAAVVVLTRKKRVSK